MQQQQQQPPMTLLAPNQQSVSQQQQLTLWALQDEQRRRLSRLSRRRRLECLALLKPVQVFTLQHLSKLVCWSCQSRHLNHSLNHSLAYCNHQSSSSHCSQLVDIGQ